VPASGPSGDTSTAATTTATTTTVKTTPTTTTAPSDELAVGVVDVAGPPIPVAFQQFGPVGGNVSSTGPKGTTAVVAAQGPLPTQALPDTGAASIEAAGLAGILMVAGLIAVRLSRGPLGARRQRIDGV
jgi:LPXTG-motif cell wall-anchored protein